MNRCPELDQWVAFHMGELDGARREVFAAHLSTCQPCSALLDKLRAHEVLADRVREAYGSSAEHLRTPPQSDAGAPAVQRDDFDEYNIVGEISRTHFSIVYEATQKGTGQRVALKVLLASAAADERSRLRFEREVELLAQLRHPNIVPIYHSGLYGGQYYFVMPYIEGLAPDAYSERERLSLRDRVTLLHTICNAVSFAHQRGIMHRDLKPSNILVDEQRRVQILDFGLAKINSEQRARSEATLTLDAGQIIGTPAYMSPEQADGRTMDIDVRSDVYSLGVIMYRILLGRMPYTVDAGLTQTLRHIHLSEPIRPCVVQRGFNRELEAIVLKALEKEPARRYQSAAALADDLERFLTRQPVLARSPSAFYHFRKLVARHKVPFALLALVFVLLATFAVTVSAQSDMLASALNTKQAVLSYMINNFIRAADPDNRPSRDVTVREMFEDMAGAVDTAFPNQPLTEAEVRNAIGSVYKVMGMYDSAEHQLRVAESEQRRLLGESHVDLAATWHNLAAVLVFKNEYEEAETLYQKALAVRKKSFGEESLPVAETLNHLAVLSTKKKDYRTAEERYRRVLDIRRKLLGDDPSVTQAVNNLGNMYRAEGDHAKAEERLGDAADNYAEAERKLREAVEKFERQYPSGHTNTAIAMHNLGRCLEARAKVDLDRGDKAASDAARDQAKTLYVGALELKRGIMDEDHPSISNSLHWLAVFYMEQPGAKPGDMAETAIPLFAEALAIRLEVYGPDHKYVAETLGKLHECLALAKEKTKEIEQSLLDRYDECRRRGEGHIATLRALRTLIGFYTAQGKTEEAAKYARKLHPQ